MSRVKTVNSRYQKTTMVNETFYIGPLEEFVSCFPDGFEAVLRQRAGAKQGTVPDLLHRVRAAHIAYRPDKARDVWLKPAKMKQKLEQLQKRLPSLPSWLMPPLNVQGKLADFEAITWLRRAFDILEGRAPMILMPGVRGRHPFDLLLDDPSRWDDIRPVVGKAIALLQAQMKCEGRQPNKNEWGFFIELCNLFHELTGEKPKVVRGRKYSSLGEVQPNIVKGNIIDFLEEIYHFYHLPDTRDGLAQKLLKSYATGTPPAKYGVKPTWI